jgi:hypothetical protein
MNFAISAAFAVAASAVRLVASTLDASAAAPAASATDPSTDISDDWMFVEKGDGPVCLPAGQIFTRVNTDENSVHAEVNF